MSPAASMTSSITDLAHQDDVVIAELVEHEGNDLAVRAARAVTDETREALWHAAAAVERAVELVTRAVEMRAHELLTDPETGAPYRTWARYCEVEFLGLRSVKIEKETRWKLVAALIEAGVSRRGAAEALGMTEGTARYGLKALAAREKATTAPAPKAAAPAAIEAAPVSSDDVATAETRTRVEQAFAQLRAAGSRGCTGPDIDDACGWRRGIAGAILSEVHKGLRVQRLSVLEPTGTRQHDGQLFAVYVEHTQEAGRATEGPGRRSRRRPR